MRGRYPEVKGAMQSNFYRVRKNTNLAENGSLLKMWYCSR